MEPTTFVIITVIALIVLLIFRVPIAYGLGIVGLSGMFYYYGWNGAFYAIPLRLHGYLANFVFTAVPLFLLMGYFALHAGFTSEAYAVGRTWLGRLRGGLASATVVASALFAACSGSGLPAAAALGRISVPEMVQYGYHPRLATGVVAASTPLAVLIPPSIIMIIYGVLADVSIARLLIAGIIPGILASSIFIGGISLWVWRNPKMAPPYEEKVSWRERILAIRKIWGIAALFLLVIGSIYLGWATPTEAAAFGAFGAMVLALVLRKLTWDNFTRSILETVSTSAMIFLIVAMAFAYALFVTRSGVIGDLVSWVVGLNPPVWGLFLALAGVYILLGMFVDSISMMVLTMPAVVPILVAMDINIVWFGIILVIFVEIAAITPPLGISVYVVKGVVGDLVSLWDIFRGTFFFFILWIIILALIMSFPQLSLWLPNTMKGAG